MQKLSIAQRASALAGAALCFTLAQGALAQTSGLPSTGTIAIPTYEAAGLTWQGPGGTAGCQVKYRVAGTSAWAQGLDLWYDSRDNQCRGSLVNLVPNTTYEVQLNLPGQAPARGLTFKTWSNQRPVAKTITVPSGTATFNVAEGGSAGGYVVYEGNGATLDAQNNAQYNVTINASYVILRGLNLRNAKQDAIRISPNVKDVIIEDNDISGWGRTRDGTWGADMDSGIRAVCTSPTMERVTIQRNRIYNPRYSANSWTNGHPAGPQGITISFCGGNHVIRHNEIFSTNGNYFNDVIGGEDNFTNTGFPNADTDIYGNKLSHGWDDGIEAEGANENVRIWGNYIDRTAIGIATTVTAIGPAYIFRNVWNRSQMYANRSLDTDDRQPFFKSGSDASLGNGRRYLIHNTMLQAVQSGLTYPLGGGFAAGGTGAAQLINNTWSKNNIYDTWKQKGAFYQVGSGNDFSNDLINGTVGEGSDVNASFGKPVYAPGHGWQSEAGGNYQLASSSPGFGRGARIPNFNDGVAAPDPGAHQSGTAAMKFGIAGSAGSSVNGSNTSTGTPANPSSPTTPTSPTSPTNPAPAPAPTQPGSGSGIAMSATVLNFSGAATQTVTYTNNTGAKVTFIQASMSSGKFGQANTCGEVAAGASCTATVTYYPSGTGTSNGTLTLTSTAPNSPHVVALTTASATALVPHFYRTILRREPDAGGKAYWDGEITRVASLGADLKEGYYALGATFFASAEYAALKRTDSGFVSDLYTAFFNRAADSAGLSYWMGQLASGLPREVALAAFMFAPEFAAYVQSAIGSSAARAEVNLVMDLYRGLLARLPDTAGFNYAVQQMRTAQCQSGAAVTAAADALSAAFLANPEYGARARSNGQFTGDAYNAMLRRGGDLPGVSYWLSQLNGGKSREEIRRAFMASPEFNARLAAVAAQGCMR